MSQIVAALYHFTRLEALPELRSALATLCEAEGIRGTLLLADEGINGTIAGPRDGIDRVIAHIRAIPGCAALEWKESIAAIMPFRRMKVRIKREIVTMGQPGVDPTASVGTYVSPEAWNDLIAREDVVVIDTRNAYETAIGTFAGAVDPCIDTFRDFPGWWQANKAKFAGKTLAMFCTGGIRCEKSTSWLKQEGAPEVYHLKGGILKYLEEVPAENSRWQGACFVFDERVSVGHGLAPGDHTLCRACGWPVTAEGRAHPDFEDGVSCPQCRDHYSAADRARFRDRQRQMVG
ncbi:MULTISPECIES: rhodanese-related sulfurtransferase [unclassified Haematobacter]|uniref:oxygen-dependent tRNA uridine(34) hydroxylase TrhO n=1 Tax=unclassified Haematobacter TaxID=2640585 RepID=UPI0025BFE569|nr:MULTISPECIES: rhodanese-related sulfurtransferase [unclassified Haematobacter]